MDFNKGKVFFSRKIREHWIWKDPAKFQWWVDLVMGANYKDTKSLARGRLFILKRGQLEASTEMLAKRWGTSRPTVITFLKLLEKDGMIQRETLYGSKAIVTICNYDSYQSQLDTSLDTSLYTSNEGVEQKTLDTSKHKVTSSKSKTSQNDVDTSLDTSLDTKRINIINNNKESSSLRSEDEKSGTDVPSPPSKAKSKSKSLSIAEKKEREQKALEKRRHEFGVSLIPFIDKYGKEMIRNFFNYWSELNKSKTKMRWELQPTWETSRRLVTWSNKDYNRNSFSNGNNTSNNAEMARAKREKEAADLVASLLAEDDAARRNKQNDTSLFGGV